MKVFRCKDIGMNCTFVTRGKTEQDILQKASEHGRSIHKMKSISPEVKKRVLSAIHDE